jgi:hypothetical protein
MVISSTPAASTTNPPGASAIVCYRSCRGANVLLSGTVEDALSSVPGFDSDTILSSTVAQQFYAGGYKFCLRYLSLGSQSPRDLSTHEANNILNAGLALMPVQHVRRPGWSPNQVLGQRDGQNAATNALAVGFPAGVNVWCDLEGVAGSVTPQDVIDYCHAWYSAVDAAGFVPGLYVGYGTQISGQQLFELSFQHYWRSQSSVPEIPNQGYQLIQFLPSTTAYGIGVDLDITQTDSKGMRSQWLRVAI